MTIRVLLCVNYRPRYPTWPTRTRRRPPSCRMPATRTWKRRRPRRNSSNRRRTSRPRARKTTTLCCATRRSPWPSSRCAKRRTVVVAGARANRARRTTSRPSRRQRLWKSGTTGRRATGPSRRARSTGSSSGRSACAGIAPRVSATRATLRPSCPTRPHASSCSTSRHLPLSISLYVCVNA